MKRKYLILFSLSGLILCADQLSKHLVQHALKLREGMDIIPGFLSFTHQHNNGFAFGYLQRAPASMQEVFVIGIPIFALILIVLIFIKLQDGQMLTSVALTSILGGAVGNLVDRVQYGFVVDFVDLHVGRSLHIPPFNIADCAILVGVGIMVVTTFSVPKEARENQV